VSASLRYGAAAVAVIGVLTLVLWPFLEAPDRLGVLVAAAVAVPVQVLAFAVLVRYRGEVRGFLAAWAGGVALRVAVVLLTALLLIRSGTQSAVPTLLALAGFFFALLLLEPIYFKLQGASVGRGS
jgi:hypothetical protein